MQRRDWLDRAAATASNELAKAVAKIVPDVSVVPDVPGRACRDGVTENRWYRVTVTNGVIYSIYDKELKRELIDGPANRFMYTRNNHKTWESEPEKALGAKVTRRVYLAENEKRIDIEDRFEHARDLFNTRRYYRYGYLAFPFAVPGGEFRAHLNGTVIRPYEDCHPMTTDAYCAVRDWCLVENADFGVALMMREQNIPRFSRESVEEPPPGWTGLIEKTRAGHGEKDGQMYILWGAEMSPDFDHYELWRDGKFLTNVTNEVPNGLPYRVARYEDLGLPTHSRHEYRIRKVWKDGRKDPLGEPFYGLTRYVH